MSNGPAHKPLEDESSLKENSRDLFLDDQSDLNIKPHSEKTHPASFLGKKSLSSLYWLAVLAGILALIAMVAILFQSDKILSNSLTDIRKASYVSELITKIEREMVSLTVSGHNFIRTKNQNYSKNYKSASKSLANDLELLLANSHSETGKKLTSTLMEGVAEHNKQFSKVTNIQGLIGSHAKVGIFSNVHGSLNSLEKALNKLDPTGKNFLLYKILSQIKIREVNLPNELDQNNKKQIYNLIRQFKIAVRATNIPIEVKKSFLKLIESHLNDFNQLTSTYLTYNNAKLRLEDISGYISPNLNDLKNHNDNFFMAARQQSDEIQEKIRQTLLSGSLLVVGLLIFFNILIIRAIIKPTSKITEASMEIANGNLAAPIPYLANKNEIGRLCNALIIFRENMLHADRLRKEVEILRQNNSKFIDENTIDSDKVVEQEHSVEKLNDGEPSSSGQNLNTEAISEISSQLTVTSQNASNAFEEVERTETMIAGLKDTSEIIEDIEILMIGISDQISLLAVQTTLQLTSEPLGENLIHIHKKREKDRADIKLGAGQSIEERISTIQNGTKHVIEEVQKIGLNIHNVRNIAKEISNAVSMEALEAANELLHHSEHLRSMLDSILDKTKSYESPLVKSKLPN